MADAELLESLAVELRRAWSIGRQLQVERLSGYARLADDADAVLDLIYHEVLVREQHGQRACLEDFLQRFPALEDRLRRLFLVHQSIEEETSRVSFVNATADSLTSVTGPSTSVRPDPTLQLASAPPGYELLEEVGRGGMALVYRARHQKLNRIVALKMLLAGAHATGETLARLEQEARAVAQLQHSSIVQIHEIGEHEGLPFLALEYVEGGTLKDWLAGRPLPPLEAATVAAQLATTMAYAHERGVVHRDLKPANVLLVWRPPDIDSPTTIRMSATQAGTAHAFPEVRTKIGDFGLAHMAEAGSELTATGQILGTPSYMAPEQASAQSEPDPLQDVYSLGAILYELLTGRAPFRGPTVLDTLDQVRNELPVPPRRLQSRIPRDIETICLKCLEKTPSRRYESAAALTADLRHFLNDEPISARAVRTTEKGVRWLRKHPAVTATTFAAVVLFVVGLSAVIHEANRANESEFDLRIQRDEARRMERMAIEERDLAEAARASAEANLQRAIAAVESLTAVGERLQQIPHQQQASQEIFNSAVTFYEDFLRPVRQDSRDSLRFATALIRSAEIGGMLGDRQAAEDQIQRAIEILEIGPQQQVSDPRSALSLAYAMWVRGTLLQSWQRPAAAQGAFEQCEVLLSELATLPLPDEQRTSVEVLAANTQVALASVHRVLGRHDQALARFAAGTAQLQTLAVQVDIPESVGFDCVQSLVNYGSALRQQGQLDEARRVLEPAVRDSRALVERQPDEPRRRSLLSFALFANGLLHQRTDKVSEALADLAEADQWLQQLVSDYPAVYEYRFRQAAVLTQRVALTLQQGERAAVLPIWQRLCDHLDDSRERFPLDVPLARWSHRWQIPFGDFQFVAQPPDLQSARSTWLAGLAAGEQLLSSPLLLESERIRSQVSHVRTLLTLPAPSTEQIQRAENLIAGLPDNAATTDSRLLATRGLLLFVQGHHAEALEVLEQARSEPQGFGRLEQWYLAMTLHLCDRSAEAADLVRRLEAAPTSLSVETARVQRVSAICRDLLQQGTGH
ncbi:MAG: serine/threonine-protein kinase [Planctomycetaceae bacterium]|nr:serine/threonine-protein kinase [Planctomycetaceae bacterium]